MKKNRLFFLIVLFISFTIGSSSARGENTKYEGVEDLPSVGEVTRGMEEMYLGDVKVIIPKGMKKYRIGTGSLINKESMERYVGRRFMDTEDQFVEVDRQLAEAEEKRNEFKKEIKKDLKALEMGKIKNTEDGIKDIKKQLEFSEIRFTRAEMKEDDLEKEISKLKGSKKELEEEVAEIKKALTEIQLSRAKEQAGKAKSSTKKGARYGKKKNTNNR